MIKLKSLSCQHLFRQSFAHGYSTQLPIAGSQTSLKPFRHHASFALRAMREDGSGMQKLNILLRILLIPQRRIFRRRISTDIRGIAGCTCAATMFLVMCTDQSDTMKHIIYLSDISSSTYRSLYASQSKPLLKRVPVDVRTDFQLHNHVIRH